MAGNTYQEWKTLIKSPENIKAGKALEIIRSGKNAEELEKMLPLQAAFYQFDPAHPRSRVQTEHLLDACYQFSEFGITEQSGNTITLGCVEETPADPQGSNIQHKLKCWTILLDNGILQTGENNWRGELFKHVLSNTISKASPWRPGNSGKPQAHGDWHLPFAAKILEKRPILHIGLANDYHWVGHPDKFQTALRMGMDVFNPQVFLTIITYLNCSPNNGETKNDRVQVLNMLIQHYKEAGKTLHPALVADAILGKDAKTTALIVENNLLQEITAISPEWETYGCGPEEFTNAELAVKTHTSSTAWEAAYQNGGQPSETQRSEHFQFQQTVQKHCRQFRTESRSIIDEFNNRYKPNENAEAA